MYGLKGKKMMAGWRKLHKGQLRILSTSSDIITVTG
jgi:hypothetical protein